MHKYDLGKTIVPAARLIMQKASVLCGLGVTENAVGGSHSIKLTGPAEFADVDRKLLKIAWTMQARSILKERTEIFINSQAGPADKIMQFQRIQTHQPLASRTDHGCRGYLSPAASRMPAWVS